MVTHHEVNNFFLIVSITLLLLRMFYSFFFSFSFSTFRRARFFSVETSAINLKLQHKVENALRSHGDIFRKSNPGSQN